MRETRDLNQDKENREMLNRKTALDKAIQGCGDAMERIARAHAEARKTAEASATKSVEAAQDKLLLAQETYEKSVARAQATLDEAHRDADNTRKQDEQAAIDEFDIKMRNAVGAPAGAHLVEYPGGRLALDLADGRPPIAAMTHAGSDVFQVEGGEGAIVMVGGALKARWELWQRARVSMHAEGGR